MKFWVNHSKFKHDYFLAWRIEKVWHSLILKFKWRLYDLFVGYRGKNDRILKSVDHKSVPSYNQEKWSSL